MQLLEQLANDNQSFDDILIEGILNNPLMEGLFKTAPIPNKFQSESKKIIDKYLDFVKSVYGEDSKEYTGQKSKYNKVFGKKKHYMFSISIDQPTTMFKVMKSLGYKECVEKNVAGGDDLRYYAKEIGDYYMSVIVSTAVSRKKDVKKGGLSIIIEYIDAKKVSEKFLSMYK